MKKAFAKTLCIILAVLTVSLSVTPAFAASKAPTLSSVKVVDVINIKASWKPVKKVNGYQLMYTNNKTKKSYKVKLKGYKTTSKTIKSLSQSTNYSVKVRTYKTVKKGKKTKTTYGKWSKTKKITTQKYVWKYLVPGRLRVDDTHNIMQIKNPSTSKWEGRYGDFKNWKSGKLKGRTYAWGLKQIYDYVQSHKPVNKYAAMFYASYYINYKYNYATELKCSNWKTKFGTSDVGYHRTNHGASLIEDYNGVCANFAALGRDMAYLFGIKARIGSNSTHAWTQFQNNSGKWVNWDLCVFSTGSYVANPYLSNLDMDMLREKSAALGIELDELYDVVYQMNEDNTVNDFIDSKTFNEEWFDDVPVIERVELVQKDDTASLKLKCSTESKQRSALSDEMIFSDDDGVLETKHIPNAINRRFGSETTWWFRYRARIQYKIIDARTNRVVESDDHIDLDGTYIVRARKIEVWKRNYAQLGEKKQYLNMCTEWSEPITVNVSDLVEQPE